MTSSSETTLELLYVLDTHALIWYLIRDKKLSKRASEIFAAAERGETELVVSAIAIAELYYANKKNRWFADFDKNYQELIDQPYFQFVDFQAKDVLDFEQDALVPEMHDRIITGLARRLNAPLLTADSLIKAANAVRVVW